MCVSSQRFADFAVGSFLKAAGTCIQARHKCVCGPSGSGPILPCIGFSASYRQVRAVGKDLAQLAVSALTPSEKGGVMMMNLAPPRRDEGARKFLTFIQPLMNNRPKD